MCHLRALSDTVFSRALTHQMDTVCAVDPGTAEVEFEFST